MGLNDYRRHSKAITDSKRWQGLRWQALRRDGFKCVICGARGRLEVDHIKPVRDRPDLAWDLNNLQTLCVSDHARKTRLELGFPDLPPARKAWRDLLQEGMEHA